MLLINLKLGERAIFIQSGVLWRTRFYKHCPVTVVRITPKQYYLHIEGTDIIKRVSKDSARLRKT